jgi:hypothetical protein
VFVLLVLFCHLWTSASEQHPLPWCRRVVTNLKKTSETKLKSALQALHLSVRVAEQWYVGLCLWSCLVQHAQGIIRICRLAAWETAEKAASVYPANIPGSKCAVRPQPRSTSLIAGHLFCHHLMLSSVPCMPLVSHAPQADFIFKTQVVCPR